MKAFKGLMTLALGACFVTMAAPAKADPPWQRNDWKHERHDNDNRHDRDRRDNRGDNRYDRDDYRFNGSNSRWNRERVVYVPARPVTIHRIDRVVVHDYISHDRWRSPRHRQYLIGAPLPRDIVYYPVPRPVLTRLAPVPYGYQYVRVDNDVLLLDTIGRIIDAVTMI